MSHPDHAAVKVLSTILGGGMAGRLFVELRDRRDLGYAASAYYDPVRRSGRADPLSGNRARQRDEGRGGAAPRDRPDSNRPRRRRGAQARERISARTNERLAWYLAFYEVEEVGQDHPERYRKAVEAVTPAGVLRVAKQYLEKVTTVVLRPR
jgi:zinc protease